MKKILFILVCMFAVANANGQRYDLGFSEEYLYRYSYIYNDSIREIVVADLTEQVYSRMEKDTSTEKKHFWENSSFIGFGFGVGRGDINPSGNFNHKTIDLDLICLNVLMSCRIGKIYDTDNYTASTSLSYQLGCLIPIFCFDKNEDIFGRSGRGKIFLAPFIEWVNEEKFTADGHYLHDNTPSEQYGHVCKVWIDTSYEKIEKHKEFGLGVMIKYECGFLLGKFTKKSMGISLGLCF